MIKNTLAGLFALALLNGALSAHAAAQTGPGCLRVVSVFCERYVKCRCYGLGGIGIPRAAHRAI